jgi:hypothetical protein
MNRRTGRGTSLTSVVGGMLVGFDEQLLRGTPRAEILVKRGASVRGLSAQGGTLEIALPDDLVVLTHPEAGEAPDASREPMSGPTTPSADFGPSATPAPAPAPMSRPTA